MLKKILSEIDNTAVLAANRLLQTTMYGELFMNTASRTEEIAPALPGTRLGLRAKLISLNRNSADIKISVLHENATGTLKRLYEARFLFVVVKQIRPGAKRTTSFDELIAFSCN